jgi:hypothetical protein
VENSRRDSHPSNLRGFLFAIIYTMAAWFNMGTIAALLVPVVFPGPEWNRQAISGITGRLGFVFVAVPLGVWAFIHCRNRPAEV